MYLRSEVLAMVDAVDTCRSAYNCNYVPVVGHDKQLLFSFDLWEETFSLEFHCLSVCQV